MLKGHLVYKGEKGDSAYDIAVKNGFKGSEAEWLATLGTSTGIEQQEISYISEGQTSFDLPEKYGTNSIVFVFVSGVLRSDYIISENKIIFDSEIPLETIVKIKVINALVKDLPIETIINENSTNNTVPSTKAIYDYFNIISEETLKEYYGG